MATIVFSPFGGVAPKLDPLALPAPMAQQAENCRITSGTLEAYKQPLQVLDPARANIKTIYRFDQDRNSDTEYWFTFTTDVNVVKGAIANDTEERTFYTGDGYPKVTTAALATTSWPYPANHYRNGVPAPTLAPIAFVDGTPSSATAIAETRVYIFTNVDYMGNESAPSSPSLPVDVKEGQSVTLQVSGLPAGPYNILTKRIYRTVTGTSSTQYLFVAEIPVATGTFDDTVSADALGEVIPSLEYDMLPESARGLTGMPNGMMAAHTDYDVYFCEPYKPHAYPVSYMQTVDYPIVGMASFSGSLAVLTNGTPYIMSGSDPSSVTVEKLAVPYACLSKRSITSAMGGVVYAAADGLVMIDNGGPKVVTDQYFTRREWQAINPSSTMCAVWDEKIFVFHETGGLILDSDGLTTISTIATAAYTDPVTGSLFLCVNDKIVKWDAGMSGTFVWRSRRIGVPMPKSFAYGQVLAATYPLTFDLYADGVLQHTQEVTDDQPFRLPSGFRARYWEIRLTGSGRIYGAMLADTTMELQNV